MHRIIYQPHPIEIGVKITQPKRGMQFCKLQFYGLKTLSKLGQCTFPDPATASSVSTLYSQCERAGTSHQRCRMVISGPGSSCAIIVQKVGAIFGRQVNAGTF